MHIPAWPYGFGLLVCLSWSVGLDELVKKDWLGKGFDSTLEELIDHLQSEVPETGLKVCLLHLNCWDLNVLFLKEIGVNERK